MGVIRDSLALISIAISNEILYSLAYSDLKQNATDTIDYNL